MSENQAEATSGDNEETVVYYVNEEDLFYWMEDPGVADIPLAALGIDFPMGCRFCI